MNWIIATLRAVSMMLAALIFSGRPYQYRQRLAGLVFDRCLHMLYITAGLKLKGGK